MKWPAVPGGRYGIGQVRRQRAWKDALSRKRKLAALLGHHAHQKDERPVQETATQR